MKETIVQSLSRMISLRQMDWQLTGFIVIFIGQIPGKIPLNWQISKET